MKKSLIYIIITLFSFGFAQEKPALERIELTTLRISKDLSFTPEQYFDTPSSGFILKAINTSTETLEEFEKTQINEEKILQNSRKLLRELELANRKGKKLQEKIKRGNTVQFMFFSTGS